MGPVSLLHPFIRFSSRNGSINEHELPAHLESAADEGMIEAIISETKGDGAHVIQDAATGVRLADRQRRMSVMDCEYISLECSPEASRLYLH